MSFVPSDLKISDINGETTFETRMKIEAFPSRNWSETNFLDNTSNVLFPVVSRTWVAIKIAFKQNDGTSVFPLPRFMPPMPREVTPRIGAIIPERDLIEGLDSIYISTSTSSHASENIHYPGCFNRRS